MVVLFLWKNKVEFVGLEGFLYLVEELGKLTIPTNNPQRQVSHMLGVSVR